MTRVTYSARLTTGLRAVLVLAWLFYFSGAMLAQQAVYPKGTNLTSFSVITDANAGSTAQKVLLSTLQGVVARRSSSQIFIDLGSGGYPVWRDYLRDTYGIPYTNQTNPWLLVQQYASLADGYILYNATNGNSVNAANSLCGLLNAVAVDASIETTANLFGLNHKLLDVSAQNEGWVWTNYFAQLSHSNVVELENWHTDNLRDYATLANAFTFFDGNSAFRTNVMSAMDPVSACFGWGDASNGEDKFVGPSSQKGVYTVAANWALDLSILSSVRDSTLTQRTYSTPPTETNVHYVTFVSTDGDNLEFDINGLYNYFQHPARGSFNMGFTVSPSAADMAPSVLRWYFDNASNGLNRDFFVAGASGCGYFYPSMYPAAELPAHVQRLNNFMTRADLSIATILDFNSYNRLDLWNQYLAQPAISALFYWEYSPYHGAHGAISFSSNGKPVIAARESLWAGLEEDTNVIANVNSASRDVFSPDAYSMVAVHVWSKDLGNVQDCVTNFLPDVRVVTPDMFANLILKNVGRRLSFDFASGAQGWVAGKGSKPADNAQWTSAEGGGALQLDGSDFGTKDNTRNSWFSRAIILPPNATTLSFDTRALNDGRLRVRLKNSSGTFFTLLDWDTPTSTNWVNRTVNLSSYAGQVVTLYFEQNDGGQSSLETRYVDNVVVLTAGPALYLAGAPKLFTPTLDVNSGINLSWRAGDDLASQFRIERLAAGGAWNEIASLPGSVTNFTDTSIAWGVSYQYRIRGWNNSGYGAYSTARDISTPAVADVIVDNPQATFSGAWLTGTGDAGHYGADYRYISSSGGATATFTPTLPVPGLYAIYVWYPQDANATANAQLSVAFNGGTSTTSINEAAKSGGWQLAFMGNNFLAGTNGFVRLANNTGELAKTVLADAVKFVYGTAPEIALGPQDTAVTQGNDTSLTVFATGSSPLSFQWRFNGNAISGATDSTYSITDTQTGAAGSYSVVVSNIYGVATSSNAALVVNIPINITAEPQDQSVRRNDMVMFFVGATGTTPISYQWQLNGADINGATASSFTLNAAQTNDAGTYSVTVSNVCGLVLSSNAVLNVDPIATPTGIPRFSSIDVSPDGSVTTVWNVAAGATYSVQYADDLRSAQWTTITNVTAADSAVSIADAPVTNAQRFYQLTSAQAASDIAGFMKLNLLGSSDTFVSIPFARATAALGVVDSVSSNTVTVSTAGSWEPGQFTNGYFIRFTSGALDGRIYPIAGNGSNTLTIETGGESIAAVAHDDFITVEPGWTVGSIFPNGAGVNVSPTVGNRNTEVLLPDLVGSGINLSASKIYYFNSGTWKIVGQGAVAHDNDVIPPNSHFIVRHNVDTNTTLVAAGVVIGSNIVVPLRSNGSFSQDNSVGLARPVAVSLDDSGLISSGAFAESLLPANRVDEMLVFDNSMAQRNKSAAAVYFYLSGGWRKVGGGTADFGAIEVFTPGTGVIIRKGTNSSQAVWVNQTPW